MFASIFGLNDFQEKLIKVQETLSQKQPRRNDKIYRLFISSMDLNNRLQQRLEAQITNSHRIYKKIVVGPPDAKSLFEEWDCELNQLKYLAIRWYSFTSTYSQTRPELHNKSDTCVNNSLGNFREILHHHCPLEILVTGILNKGHTNLIAYIKECQNKVDTWNENTLYQIDSILFLNEIFLGNKYVEELIDINMVLKTIAESFTNQYLIILSKMIAKLIPDSGVRKPTILHLNV